MSSLTTKAINVRQGAFHVSDAADDLLYCILGSCIATCLYDPVMRLGGMNHFLLPGQDPNAAGEVKYGAHAMEQLVNALLRKGAARHRLEARVFGGAKIIRSSNNIGENNAHFALTFIRNEGFKLRQSDTGGTQGRRLEFRPSLGVAHVDLLPDRTAPIPQMPSTRPPTTGGNIELF